MIWPWPRSAGKRKPDGESRGNAHGAGVADEDGVKVGTVSAARVAGVVDVAASPALSSLVIFDGGHHVIVNRPRHLEIGVRVRGVHHFLRPGPDLAVDRNQTVRLKPARQIGWRRGPGFRGHVHQRLNAFPPSGLKRQRDGNVSLLGVVELKMQNRDALIAGRDLVRIRRIDMQVHDPLIRIVVWNRNPKLHFLSAGRQILERRLVLESEVPLAHGTGQHQA